MGIFGTEAPKIIVNIDTTQDEVLLDYSVILKDEPELDTYGVKAVRTGKQVFTNAGKHWIFEVKIHLWKYADPKAKYLELKSYEGTEVILYRHRDGPPIYDSYDNQGHFIIVSVVEQYTDSANLFDYLTIVFRSINYIANVQETMPETNMTAREIIYADNQSPYYANMIVATVGFDASVGYTNYTFLPNELGNRKVVRSNTYPFNFLGDAITGEPMNYAVFIVDKFKGFGSLSGYSLNFRNEDPLTRDLVIANSLDAVTGRFDIYYNNIRTLSDAISGYDRREYSLKLYLFEQNKQTVYLSGIKVLEMKNIITTPPILNATMNFGGSSSNYDGDWGSFIGGIHIYTVPLGYNFMRSELNDAAHSIVDFFNDPLIHWSDL